MTTESPASTTEADQGLSDDEAARRLARDGPNRLPQAARRSLLRIAFEVVRQPMIALLLATTLAYALLGSVGDAIGLLVSVLLVAAISIHQQQRTERVLESLRDLASPRSRVVRGGRVRRIPSTELVCGDTLLVAEGDRLACDAQLVRADALQLDESMQTGESAPVLKATGQALYAGTLVVAGQGMGRVSATGAATALGRIGSSMAGIAPRASRVQAELDRTVRWVAVYAVLASLLAAALYVAQRGSWGEGLLAGLTLAMALIPEEFAVVWTVMMALGAWRLAQQQVLTRQPQAIEALGTTTVLAVDKTGTLTVNRMALVALATPEAQARIEGDAPAPAAFDALLDAAARAADGEGIEPMDRAIHRLRARSAGAPLPGAELLHRVGIAPERLYVSHWWRDDDEGRVVVKGAPEAVRPLCGLDANEARAAGQAADALADAGLRVLAVAEGRWDASAPPPATMPRLHWIGLLGFLDPLREDVPAAIAQCRAAGIAVVMLTGDAPLTARAIARAAGLPVDEVLTGAQAAALDDAALRARLATSAVCARVAPEQKLRIVRALQGGGAVVAMTGDGVNDAPALRAADIGVAMGERGTDVAREAASLVLQDDRFGSLVAGVRLGRRIFVNLRKSVGYLLAVHVPIVGVALLPFVAGGPQLLLPLHVVFLELLIDPACSLVFEAEPEAPDAMRVPPRPAGEGLLSRALVARALAVGAVGLVFVVAVQAAARAAGADDAWLRAAALGAVIVTNVAMLMWFRVGARTWHRHARNPAFMLLVATLTAACGLVLGWAPLAARFGLPVGVGAQAAGLLVLGVGTAALGALFVTSRRRGWAW